MTLCVNHVTLPTVKGKYSKKTVRLISPEGLWVKNPDLIFTILAYTAIYLWHWKNFTAPVWFTGNKQKSDILGPFALG